MPAGTLQSWLSNSPLLALAVAAVVAAILLLQRRLPYRWYRWLHLGKVNLAARYGEWFRERGRPVIRYKRVYGSEFVGQDPRDPRAVFAALRDGGFSPHLPATVKARYVSGDDRQFAHSQLVTIHDDGFQTEVYLFRRADGNGTDVYAHVEPNAADVDDHLGGDQQVSGDARGAVSDVLATV